MGTPKKKQQIILANPVVQTPYSTSSWFVKPPEPTKYIARGGNKIELLNCGDSYLPKLFNAILGAKKSVYIAIWGFNPHLSLVLNSTNENHEIGKVLQKLAKEKNIEVKILVWHQWIANMGNASAGDSSLHNPISLGWNQKAMRGRFDNIEFITRNPTGAVASRQTTITVEDIDERINEILETSPRNRRGGLQVNAKNQINLLNDKRKLLNKVGYGAYHAQQQRWGEDDFGNKLSSQREIPTGTIGSFPTHHQKTILVDHEHPDDAIGFVQGFNFWPKYFDESEHPYRGQNGKNNRIQDVGVRIKGSALIDIYNNFSQSWNQERGKAIPTNPPQINPKGDYNCQILRTWRDDDEFNINAFYEKAFANMNQFIYVEDQYFRQPEFARALKKRAQEIRNKSGNKKKLHVFAITNPNAEAVGGIDVRAGMMDELNRSDVKVDEKQFEATQKSQQALDKIKKQMEQVGVMVHICRLRNSKSFDPAKRPGGHAGRGWKATRYASIYVHSKLTLFDNAYLTLGSANWNHRSMFTDTELNIAIQFHNSTAQDFREKLWRFHLNGLWDSQDLGKTTTPKAWYKQWDELLRKNFFAYTDQKALIMNLFPYYEDLAKERERGFLNEMKQGST